MLSGLYEKIVLESTFGYTLSEIVRDETGKPVDYVFREVNAVYAAMIGRTREQIVNHRVTEVFADIGEDSFDWIGFFGDIALSGKKTEFEEYSRPLDRWYHFSVMSPEQGFVVVLSFDITEKRKAELRLIESEERNRRYIDSAPDGIFIIDDRGKFEHINPAGCDMLGYTKKEALNLTIASIQSHTEKEANCKAISQLRATGKVTRKAHLTKKDGTDITAYIESVSLPERQFMSFCRDITDQELNAREKERYYTAFESMSQPIVITDAEGKILAVNNACVSMYGYTKEEAFGKNPKVLNPGTAVYENFGYSKENYDSLFRGLWKSVRNPSIRTWQGTVINRRKNGSLVWVNLIVNGVYNENNELESIIGLPVDITRTREREDRTRIQLFQTIADLAELRDDDTGNHMKRVGIFTRILAKACGMSEKYCQDIEIFAPMHDIGKVGILDSILRAPRKLSDEEFNIMKTHTLLGYSIIKGKTDFEMASEITLNHHERFDGTGYPNALIGIEIPLSAQITSIADVYDALRSKRPYKESWTHEKTVKFITESSGKQFDPDLVSHFIELNRRFETIFLELKD